MPSTNRGDIRSIYLNSSSWFRTCRGDWSEHDRAEILGISRNDSQLGDAAGHKLPSRDLRLPTRHYVFLFRRAEISLPHLRDGCELGVDHVRDIVFHGLAEQQTGAPLGESVAFQQPR